MACGVPEPHIWVSKIRKVKVQSCCGSRKEDSGFLKRGLLLLLFSCCYNFAITFITVSGKGLPVLVLWPSVRCQEWTTMKAEGRSGDSQAAILILNASSRQRLHPVAQTIWVCAAEEMCVCIYLYIHTVCIFMCRWSYVYLCLPLCLLLTLRSLYISIYICVCIHIYIYTYISSYFLFTFTVVPAPVS